MWISTDARSALQQPRLPHDPLCRAQAGALLRRAAATKWRPQPRPRAEGMPRGGGVSAPIPSSRSLPPGTGLQACSTSGPALTWRSKPSRPWWCAPPSPAAAPPRCPCPPAPRTSVPPLGRGQPSAPRLSARPPAWQRAPGERPIPAGPANGAARRPASTMGDVVRGRRAVTGVAGAPLCHLRVAPEEGTAAEQRLHPRSCGCFVCHGASVPSGTRD